MTIPLAWTPRPQQTELAEFVKQEIEEGKKFFILESPVGTGKSYAAVMIMNYYQQLFENAKFDIATNTKILQNQYRRDFPWMIELLGKSNYSCRPYQTDCLVGSLKATQDKNRCPVCPYRAALQQFIKSTVGILNFHLLSTFVLFRPEMYGKRGTNMLIVDEAHDLEEVVSSFITVNVSTKTLSEFNHPDMMNFIQQVKNFNTEHADSKHQFVALLLELKDMLKWEVQVNSKEDKASNPRILKRAMDLSYRIEQIIEEQQSQARDPLPDWTLEKSSNQTKTLTTLTLQPIWGGPYLRDIFWPSYDHVVLMSGTILNKELFCQLNGIDPEEASFISLPSPFPVENRPIKFLNIGSLSYNQRKETMKDMVPVIDDILNHHKKDKGIIHTGNYELSQILFDKTKNKNRMLQYDTDTRSSSLKEHLESKRATVLVGPSMMNGVDLKDEFSRFQVILKIPYPNLGSERIVKRKDQMPDWYTWRTMVDVIQSYGRSIRSDKDWAVTYILDSGFSRLMTSYRIRIPKYISQAIKKDN